MKIATIFTKISEFISQKFYELLLALIGLLNVLPILAPIFAKLGWFWPAKVIYFVYSFFCHQLHWRSLHVCDHQYGWCTRCTGIWLNVLITGVLVKVFKIQGVKWYWILILMVPMALDGIVQTIATLMGFTTSSEIYYMSNSVVRMLTGSLFGIGFGLWIWTSLAINLNKEALAARKVKLSNLQVFLIAIIISTLFYVIAVTVWDATSNSIKPANLFDFAVKTPILPQDFLIRGKDTL